MNEFDEILEKMKFILGVEKDSEVAEAIGMKPSAFANRKKSSSIPFSNYIALAQSRNVNLNWLITNEGPVYKDQTQAENGASGNPDKNNPVSEKDDLIVIEQIDLVQEFEDRKRVLRINENLLKIEKKNKQAFRDMENYVAGVANGLKYSPDRENTNSDFPDNPEPQREKNEKETT